MILARAIMHTRYPELYGHGEHIGYKLFNSIEGFKQWAYSRFDIVKYTNSKEPTYLADHDNSYIVELRKVKDIENVEELVYTDYEVLFNCA